MQRVLVRTVSGCYERRARRAGTPRPQAGAVAFVQRFDSGLRLNVHFHVLWLDGVYGGEPGGAGRWRAHGGVTVEAVASCRLLPRRVVPHAPRKGRRRYGRRRYTWAELLKLVFLIDVRVCPGCSGARKVLAAIHDPAAIARVLAALGFDSAVPEMAPARAPSGEEWWGA